MRRLLAIAAAAAVCATCGCAPRDEGLRIAAAASLQGAMGDLVAAFEDETGADVAPVVYDGSSVLAAQLTEGAPFDVAAFADEASMDRVSDVVADPRTFATNRLVIAVPTGSDAVRSLDDLADPSLDVVLCAAEVPCGRAAGEALEAAGIDVAPASLEQSVTAVATKVRSGGADAGLVYATDAAADDGIEGIREDALDGVVNAYPIAAVADARHRDDADAFVRFALSDEGRAILAAWGFGAP